ncbi:MAG: hypothetical protein AAGA30_02070 [Planctomycetota bacterium]
MWYVYPIGWGLVDMSVDVTESVAGFEGGRDRTRVQSVATNCLTTVLGNPRIHWECTDGCACPCSAISDVRLGRLVHQWETLSNEVRSAILLLVDASIESRINSIHSPFDLFGEKD